MVFRKQYPSTLNTFVLLLFHSTVNPIDHTCHTATDTSMAAPNPIIYSGMQLNYSKPQDYVRQKAASLLGPHFDFNPPDTIDDHEPTGFVVYDTLTKVCPSPHQSANNGIQMGKNSFFRHDRGNPCSSGAKSRNLSRLCSKSPRSHWRHRSPSSCSFTRVF